MRRYKLKEISNIYNGSTPSTSDASNYDGDIIWITPKDLSNQKSKYVSKGERNITEKGYKNCSTTMLPKGTILLSSRAPIGLLAIAKTELCTNQGFKNIVPQKELVDNNYLYYLLRLKIKEIEALGSGTTFKEVSKTSLENYEIDIHDIAEQQKISNILNAIDDKIALNNKINQELEQMAKTLYDYWFVQFDFPDEKGRPYKSAKGKMVYNEVLKREIPEGWEVKNIFDVLDIQYGYPFNTELFTDNGGYSVVRIRDILTNSISAHTLEKVDDKYKLHEGDLLIGMDGNFHMNYWNETGAYLNQRCVRIRCKEEQALSIIQAKYSLEPFIKKREQNISRTTVGHLSDKDFKSQYILVPKVNPNFHPKETFESILYRITNNNNEIKNLVVLRDFLLPLLMNGQVSIRN